MLVAFVDAVTHAPDAVIIVAAVLTALGVIWRRFIIPTNALLQRIDKSLGYVESEMKFNGGATQRDAIKRIEEYVEHLDARLTQIEANTKKIEQEVVDE